MEPQQKLRIYVLQHQRRLGLTDFDVSRRSGGLLAADRVKLLTAGHMSPADLRLSDLVALSLALSVPVREVLDMAGWHLMPGRESGPTQ